MSLDTRHPLYTKRLEDWELMDDSWHGERRVKEKHIKYLPPTPGQILDGMGANQTGLKNYNAYKTRARFPDFISQAVEALLGIMHHKPATIELPEKMEPLRERATIRGESLQMLIRRVNEHQLVTGRLGLLSDIPNDAPVGVLPYIAMYKALDVVNWDDEAVDEQAHRQLNLVVLNESRWVRDEFKWVFKKKYRVLLLGDAESGDGRLYKMGLFGADGKDGTTFNAEELITPSVAGSTLDQIPFVVINSKDIVAEPDDPPLLGLANLSMTVYRGEADYRQALFMQGQDTLVIIGSTDDEVRAGAGAHINVAQGGDAKYIGVDSRGLQEMRESLVNDKKEASYSGGRLIDNQGREAESGEALRIRVSARTASLNQIAMAGAEGVQTILRTIATWIGADPEKVIVTPNLDFADDTLDGRTLVEYMSAKALGLPWSKQSIHRKLQEKDLTEMEFEEEMAAIEAEGGAEGDDGTGEPNEDIDEDDQDE